MGLYEVRLPELGEGLHEGTLSKWLVKAGDAVKEDDALAEIENDKALVELPSPTDGTVKQLHVEEGTVSTVGDLLVTLEVAGEGNVQASGQGGAAVSPAVSETERQVTAVSQATPADGEPSAQEQNGGSPPAAVGSDRQSSANATMRTQTAQQTPAHSAAQEILATPGVRKYAREHDVDIERVTGTGTNGKITLQDVDAFLQHATAGQTGQGTAGQGVQGTADLAAGGGAQAGDGSSAAVQGAPSGAIAGEREERIALTQVRKVIAKAMAKSVYTAPHVTVMDEANVTQLVQMREELKPLAAERGIKLTYLPFVVKALVASLRLHPTINGSYDEERGELIVKHYYHVGIATDTDRGLLVPVVRDADRKNMWQIAAEIGDLAKRGREGKLSGDELHGSTISITNIGSAGGMFFTPVINYPELAILGLGRITEKPIIEHGEVTGAHMMALSLSFDHRMIDGVLAQQCVNDIKRLLENPRLLLMEV